MVVPGMCQRNIAALFKTPPLLLIVVLAYMMCMIGGYTCQCYSGHWHYIRIIGLAYVHSYLQRVPVVPSDSTGTKGN